MTPNVNILKRICGLAIPFTLIILLGCSADNEDNEPAGRSGAITMRLAVARSSRDAPKPAVRHAVSATDICNDYLIDTIDVWVYRTGDGAEVASAQEACAAHSLTIAGVPAGESLYIVCKGSMAGAPVWQGRRDDVVAKAGQRTDIGVIQMQYIGTDNTAPEIASTFPAADAANVDLFSPVVVVFTEKLAPGTIADPAIVVSTGETPVPGLVGYDSGSQTIRFMPANGFQTETTYTVKLQSRSDDSGTLTDIEGHPFSGDVRWQFTTRGVEDNTLPQVIATSPPSDTAKLSLHMPITVLFSEPMDPESFAGDALQVTSDQGAVSGRTIYDARSRTLSFTPDSTLEKGLFYTAVLSSQARDLAENRLVATYTWQFIAGGYIIETSVIPESGCAGTIRPANAIVLHGEDITVDILVKPYHHLSGLMVDGSPVSPATVSTFENVTDNHTIQAIIKSNAKIISGDTIYSDLKGLQINSQGHVVWMAKKMPVEADTDPVWDIYFYDNDESSVTNISEDKSPHGDDYSPKINAQGHVVWEGNERQNGSLLPRENIFFYDRSTVTNISEGENPDGRNSSPQINDQGYVVWAGSKPASGTDTPPPHDIYFYNRSTVTNISEGENPDYDDIAPQINAQGFVVWERKISQFNSGMGPRAIYYYDGSTVDNISESQNPDGFNHSPKISAQGFAVWEGRKPQTGSDWGPWEIYYYDRPTTTNISQAVNPDGNNMMHSINARGVVVWEGEKPPTGLEWEPRDIYCYDRSMVSNISENRNPGGFNYVPSINAQGVVVWFGAKPATEADPSPDSDIYYHDGSAATNISEVVNPNSFDGFHIVNSQGFVVWYGSKPETETDPAPDSDIYYYDGSTVTNISEAENPNGDDWRPKINAQGLVVWYGPSKTVYLSHP
jgi:hypothetical protein